MGGHEFTPRHASSVSAQQPADRGALALAGITQRRLFKDCGDGILGATEQVLLANPVAQYRVAQKHEGVILEPA